MFKISIFKGERSCRVWTKDFKKFECFECGSEFGSDVLEGKLKENYGSTWEKKMEEFIKSEMQFNCEHKLSKIPHKYICEICGKGFNGLGAYAYLELNFKGDWKKEWERLNAR